MDSIDLDILKFMSERENYERYKDSITKNLCTKESWLLIGDYGRYFNDYPNVTEIDNDFILWFRVSGHPGWKPEEHALYGKIISNVQANPSPQRDVFLAQLERTRQTEAIGKLHGDLRSGSITLDKFHREVSGLPQSHSNQRQSTIQTFTLDSILTQQATSPGLYWRLEDLNKSIGPLRKGDFVVVGKRPEVGGTSFLVSEMSHMLEQADNAILFNNEEAPDKVYSRMVSTALNVDHRAMMTAHQHHQQKYDQWLGHRTWDLDYSTSMTIHSINLQLEEKEYDIIGINVLLKVGGTTAEADHDKFQTLGEECRRIAQTHGPVIAIVQADPSAEGVRFIPQDRIYKSKTALQGEADALIMIGRDTDVPDNLRYIHVAKNKLPPASCVELSCKRLKSEVEFDVSTGRYTSLNFKGNSRAN